MRNLKVLGLALIAVFAMSAVAASMATADDLTSESSPVTLTGKNDPPPFDEFVITAGNTTCKTVNYTATTITPTTSVTVKAEYPTFHKNEAGVEEHNCKSLGLPATIDMNGCAYVFSINGVAPTTQGDVAIECPTIGGVKQEITVTAFGGPTIKCTIHVPEQTLPANSVTYKTIGAGATREITVVVNVVSGVNSLKYSHTEGTGLGKCTPGSANNGTFKGQGVITGSNDVGGAGHVGLFLS